VALNFLYVDTAAMQIILNQNKFDVILTENLFGDILSDEASAITGFWIISFCFLWYYNALLNLYTVLIHWLKVKILQINCINISAATFRAFWSS
jgi:hypothetical protein